MWPAIIYWTFGGIAILGVFSVALTEATRTAYARGRNDGRNAARGGHHKNTEENASSSNQQEKP